MKTKANNKFVQCYSKNVSYSLEQTDGKGVSTLASSSSKSYSLVGPKRSTIRKRPTSSKQPSFSWKSYSLTKRKRSTSSEPLTSFKRHRSSTRSLEGQHDDMLVSSSSTKERKDMHDTPSSSKYHTSSVECTPCKTERPRATSECPELPSPKPDRWYTTGEETPHRPTNSKRSRIVKPKTRTKLEFGKVPRKGDDDE